MTLNYDLTAFFANQAAMGIGPWATHPAAQQSSAVATTYTPPRATGHTAAATHAIVPKVVHPAAPTPTHVATVVAKPIKYHPPTILGRSKKNITRADLGEPAF